jgi:tight adherence protein C
VDIVKLLTDRNFLIAVLAAVSAAAAVFTFGMQFIGRSEMKERIKRVALEREKMRAEEMSRLRGDRGVERATMRREDNSRTYMRKSSTGSRSRKPSRTRERPMRWPAPAIAGRGP